MRLLSAPNSCVGVGKRIGRAILHMRISQFYPVKDYFAAMSGCFSLMGRNVSVDAIRSCGRFTHSRRFGCPYPPNASVCRSDADKDCLIRLRACARIEDRMAAELAYLTCANSLLSSSAANSRPNSDRPNLPIDWFGGLRRHQLSEQKSKKWRLPMPDVDLPIPFQAYMGDEPYVFVSYAHKDGRVVFTELQALHQKGVRIWYDEGIDPGNEWPEEIAKALDRAMVFLVFISKVAVESRNVRNEINFALNRGKRFIAIHLEDTQLPPGLELRMGDIQAIMKWRMTDDHYSKKVQFSLPVTVCGVIPRPQPELLLALDPPPATAARDQERILRQAEEIVRREEAKVRWARKESLARAKANLYEFRDTTESSPKGYEGRFGLASDLCSEGYLECNSWDPGEGKWVYEYYITEKGRNFLESNE
jgi:TIR domain